MTRKRRHDVDSKGPSASKATAEVGQGGAANGCHCETTVRAASVSIGIGHTSDLTRMPHAAQPARPQTPRRPKDCCWTLRPRLPSPSGAPERRRRRFMRGQVEADARESRAK